RTFVAGQIKRLDRAAQLALAEAAYGDGQIDPVRFRAKYGLTFPPEGMHWGGGGYYGYYGYYSPSGHGHKRGQAQNPPRLFFCHGRVPRDLQAIVREILPPPPEFVLEAHDELPATVPGRAGAEPLTVYLTEANALHDLAATLAVVRQGKLAVSEVTR